jgi:HK97 family phage prohead protease
MTEPTAEPTRAETKIARQQMRGVREVRRMPAGGFEMREIPNGTGGTWLVCSGYASVTCASMDDFSHCYEMEDWLGPYQEGVVRGAFGKTLAESADVAFLTNHSGVTMARTKPGTLKLAEDRNGLRYEAKLNPTRSDVQILKAAVEDGAIDESSFAFRVVRQTWSYEEDNGEIDRRWLQEINLDKGDVSPVNYGANPHTADHPLAMRNRLAAGRRERTSRASSAVLPDYGPRAHLALARARFPRKPESVHDMVVDDIRAGRLSDPVAEARRKLEALRHR